MTRLKQLLSKFTPPVVVAIAVAVLAAVAAFGVTLSATQQGAVVLFVGAGALLLTKLPTVESLVGLATAAIAVAVAFGLPVTSAQRESIVILTGTIAALVVGKGAMQTLQARRAARSVSTAIAAHTYALEACKVASTELVAVIERISGRMVGSRQHRKTGRRKPKNAPALLLKRLLTGVIPAHPAVADHIGKLAFGLYGNDKYGVCGPTSVANLIRLITGGLLGVEITPSQEDVYDLYRRSGNPNFDPKTDADDEGVDMQTMLEALLAGGIGDGKGGKVKPVAFAKVDVNSDAELEAAVAIFGGVLWGVNLETAQEAQTDATPPKWDYKKSPKWGGHAVLNGAYEGVSLEDVISWATRVQTTGPFRANQLEEAWVVIFPWHLEHPAFQVGVDVYALAAAYEELTGKKLVIPTPSPSPSPSPASLTPNAADLALWGYVKDWVTEHRHSGEAGSAAAALKAWAKAGGLL